MCPWPGASAEKIEQLVTRRIEEKVAENVRVDKIESNTRTGITAVYITLVEGTRDTGKEFDDIKLKLDAITDLPDGAGPIDFVKDFGDTAALMLTVASPRVDDREVDGARERAAAGDRRDEKRAAASAATAAGAGARSTLAQGMPVNVPVELVQRPLRLFAEAGDGRRAARAMRASSSAAASSASTARPAPTTARSKPSPQRFTRERLHASEFHPDAWPAVIVRDPAETLSAAARRGRRQVQLSRAGRLHRSDLADAQDAADRLQGDARRPAAGARLSRILAGAARRLRRQRRVSSIACSARATSPCPAASSKSGDKNLTVDPSGEFKHEQEIGDVLVSTTNGRSLYLRDVATVARGYESPARFLNFHTHRGEDGAWRRSRAVTLAVQMRAGQKIGDFGTLVDAQARERCGSRSCPPIWCSPALPISRGRWRRTSTCSWAASTKRSRSSSSCR